EAKQEFQAVDERGILQALMTVPIETWQYSAQDLDVRHIGPTAQDFAEAFGVGEDDRHISTVDADGVALAAIQGLYQMVIGERAANAAGLMPGLVLVQTHPSRLRRRHVDQPLSLSLHRVRPDLVSALG